MLQTRLTVRVEMPGMRAAVGRGEVDLRTHEMVRGMGRRAGKAGHQVWLEGDWKGGEPPQKSSSSHHHSSSCTSLGMGDLACWFTTWQENHKDRGRQGG